MTKTELLADIKGYVLSIPNTQIEQGVWTTEELNRAIVEAYNRGIDDALKLYYNTPLEEGEQDMFDRDLESLKV